MRYEDVRRSRGGEGFFSRFKLFLATVRKPRTPISSVRALSDRELKDIAVTIGFDRPVDWWRFR